jgi:DNA replication protein DnaC
VARSNCRICKGTGFVTQERDGALFASACKCVRTGKAEKIFHNSGIPQRYIQRCDFGTFVPSTALQEKTLTRARRFAEEYPALPEGRGMLFIGPCGVGKTHLAVAILLEILKTKGMPVLFADLNEVYREIRASYDGRAGETEYDIMAPLVDAPLLLLDELGCVASPWAQDTLHYIVNQRYSAQLPTLLTTNYMDDPAQGETSLEDRIGTRTRSRLAEMCVTATIDGRDYRRERGGTCA